MIIAKEPSETSAEKRPGSDRALHTIPTEAPSRCLGTTFPINVAYNGVAVAQGWRRPLGARGPKLGWLNFCFPSQWSVWVRGVRRCSESFLTLQTVPLTRWRRLTFLQIPSGKGAGRFYRGLVANPQVRATVVFFKALCC